jgi:hypothetical protein
MQVLRRPSEPAGVTFHVGTSKSFPVAHVPGVMSEDLQSRLTGHLVGRRYDSDSLRMNNRVFAMPNGRYPGFPASVCGEILMSGQRAVTDSRIN